MLLVLCFRAKINNGRGSGNRFWGKMRTPGFLFRTNPKLSLFSFVFSTFINQGTMCEELITDSVSVYVEEFPHCLDLGPGDSAVELPPDQLLPGQLPSSHLHLQQQVEPANARRTKRCRACVAGEQNNKLACNLKKVGGLHCFLELFMCVILPSSGQRVILYIYLPS
jgi:hypothetical protein